MDQESLENRRLVLSSQESTAGSIPKILEHLK